MKKLLINLSILSILALFSCDVEQTEKGDLPDVDVEVTSEEGNMPEYDINWMDVNVGTKTKTVTVPKLQVTMDEEEVEVPYITAQWPADFDQEVMEQTIMVQAEVINDDAELEIEEIYAAPNVLYVISELEAEDDENENVNSLRLTDQVVISAPDLAVKHYIIGGKPARSFNNAYSYIDSMEDILDRLDNTQKIYG